MQPLAPRWNRVPEALKPDLLVGSVGSFHLLALATDALNAVGDAGIDADARAACLDTGRDLLLAAWEDNLLDGNLAGQIVLLDKRAPWLSSRMADLLRVLAQVWNRPEDLRYYERLAVNMDFDKLRRYLDTQADKEPGNMYWLQQALAVAELEGSLDWGMEHVERAAANADAALSPLLAQARAMLRHAAGNHAAAAPEYEIALTGVPAGPGAWTAPLAGLAECDLVLGSRDAALARMARVVDLRPWHAQGLLRLHDLLAGLDEHDPQPFPGSCVALLYTWNKAADLDHTLSALARTAPDLPCIVLDNGSTDDTPQIIEAWADRLGDRFEKLALPVNVGAAAARNWLRGLPRVQEADFALYLDDDAEVDDGWLAHLGRAVAAYPDASAWGCRILDHGAPHIVQSADLHICMDVAGAGSDIPTAVASDRFDPTRAADTPFNVSDIHGQVPDLDRFGYLRPCVSVTGCCHLFRTRELDEGGPFRLHLSPSQYDDLERDLRQADNGRMACYTGFATVRHRKRTGKAVRMQPAQYGNALANKYKLHHLFTPERIRRMRNMQTQALAMDLVAKLERLDGWLAESPAEG